MFFAAVAVLHRLRAHFEAKPVNPVQYRIVAIMREHLMDSVEILHLGIEITDKLAVSTMTEVVYR